MISIPAVPECLAAALTPVALTSAVFLHEGQSISQVDTASVVVSALTVRTAVVCFIYISFTFHLNAFSSVLHSDSASA